MSGRLALMLRNAISCCSNLSFPEQRFHVVRLNSQHKVTRPHRSVPRFYLQFSHTIKHNKQEAFEKCWAHLPLRAGARPNFILPFTRCRYCRTPPTHRCRRRRQRVTEGTAMAPWNGPNNQTYTRF